MLYIVSFIIILANIVNKNNKLLFLLTIIFMWILGGWSYGTADYYNYNNIYNWSLNEIQINNTEIGFSMIMRICNKFGLNYQQFLIIIFAIGLILIGYTIMKYSKTPNMVLAAYFIFTFIINATQFRQFLATSIFVFSFQYLLGKDRKSDVKYIVGVMVASSIHFSAIFMLLLLLPKKYNIRKVSYITIIGILILSLLYLINSNRYIISILEIFNIKLILKITNIIGSSVNKYSWLLILRWCIKIIEFFVLFCVMQYFALCMRNKRKDKINFKVSKVNTLNINYPLILKSNIIMLLLIPLTFISVDIYRVQHMIVIWNYITICSYFDINIHKLSTTRKNACLSCMLIIFAFLNLRGLVLSNNNINTVFYVLFNNNLFFK